MVRRFLTITGLILCSLASTVAPAAASFMPLEWQPESGDVFVVDVPKNIGYLVHADGEYLSFPVATGRKSVVHYIGRTYRAETPIRTWEAKQFQIQGDRKTFGKNGYFLRLFRNGQSSAYGIHPYYRADDWLNLDERYFSMGCILVTDDIMDIMIATFKANDDNLTVITTNDSDLVLAQLKAL